MGLTIELIQSEDKQSPRLLSGQAADGAFRIGGRSGEAPSDFVFLAKRSGREYVQTLSVCV